MKLSTFLMSGSLLLLASCGGQNSDRATANEEDNAADSAMMALEAASKAKADSIAAAQAKADSIAAAEELTKADEATIRAIYKAVFSDNTSAVRNLCTPEVVNKLRAANEYDTGEIALWELRSSFQDGPSDVCKVTGITPAGDGWYKVSMLDMGNKATKRVHIVDGKLAGYK